MKRMSIVVAGNGMVVCGLIGAAKYLNDQIFDRTENGEAFPGEHVVRLPRRMSRMAKHENIAAMLLRLRAWTYPALREDG